MGQSLHRAVAEGRLAEALSAVVLVCSGGEIAPSSAPTSSNPACSSSNPACSSGHLSARIQSLIEKKHTYESAAEAEIEASKDTWSEERERKVDSGEQSSAVANKAFFRCLQEQYVGDSDRSFFLDWSSGNELGEKIAEGAQGAIHKLCGYELGAVKVFKLEGWSLEELHKTWSPGMLNYLKVQSKSTFSIGGVAVIGCGVLLEDGRFGFNMIRYWGDLRKMIDYRMVQNDNQASPFNVRETFVIMGGIAYGMRELHKIDIVHGDLKAANVLLLPHTYLAAIEKFSVDRNEIMDLEFDPSTGLDYTISVADFECSGGVVGTGFWRAPEILIALRDRCFEQNLRTEKSDVYSYAMTCYEIITGKIPFEGERPKDYDIVLGGRRPELPSGTSQWIRSMVESCWHHEPSKRPSFQEVMEKFDVICDEAFGNDATWDKLNASSNLQLLEDVVRYMKF